jgi:TPR repeat protein
MTNKAFLLYK